MRAPSRPAPGIFLLLCLALAGAGAQAAPEPRGDEPIGRIDLRDVTVGDALRMLADQSGMNIVASQKASAIRTALYLRDVRPREVLDALAKAYNLWYRQDPGSRIIRLYTAEEFRLGEVDALTEQTEVFTLSYPNALEVAYAIRDLFGARVYLSLGADRNQDVIDDLQQRFERFDIVNSRSQTITGAQGGGGGTSETTTGSTDARFEGGITPFQGQSGVRSEVTAQDVEGAYLTGQALKRVEGLVAGSEQEGRAGLGAVVQRLSPIHVTVIRNQNRVLVRTRDPQALAEIRRLVKDLDLSASTLLMEVKILSVDLTDGFDSVFDFDITSGDLVASILPGARTIDAALLATFVNDKFNARLQLLEREGRVTQLATPMLLTANQEVSRVFVGEERPVTTGFSSSSTVTGGTALIGDTVQPILVPQTEVRPVGTTLLLTPNINADRSVSVRIVVEQSNVTGTATIPVALNTGAGGQGGIQEAQVDVVGSRTFSGTVVTQDNTAVAVGGLIEDAATDRDRKVPLLGDVPVLGALFRDRSRERTRRELIVILRPHVMLTPTETVRRSQEFLQGRSVHPGAAPGSPELDIYRNPSAAHAGYELQPEHRLYPGQDAAAHPPGEPAAEDPAPPAADGDEASYAELTRFAAQATVRPAATRPPAGVRPAALPSRAPVALTTDAAIEATPVASWIGRGLSVTAVRLRNRTGSERRLGPLQLRGRWLAATFQTERLGGSGTPQDATYLYLVAARPFAEALGQ